MASSLKASEFINHTGSELVSNVERKRLELDQTSVVGRGSITECTQCGRHFTSFKYLTMHHMAIHRVANGVSDDVSVVMAAESDADCSRSRMQYCITQHSPRTYVDSSDALDFRLSALDALSHGCKSKIEECQRVIDKPLSELVSEKKQVVLADVEMAPQQPVVRSNSHNELTHKVQTVTQETEQELHKFVGKWANDSDVKLSPKSNPICPVCHKRLSHNSSLRNHQRTHTGDRPFICHICSIGFKERYHLKKHTLYKHTNEMRERCQECGKAFKDTTAVRAHIRIHSESRPYTCTRCGKAFKTTECLWHHSHRNKPCDVTKSDVPRDMKSHRVMHAGLLLLANSAEKFQSWGNDVIKSVEENVFTVTSSSNEVKTTVDEVSVTPIGPSDTIIEDYKPYSTRRQCYR
jgi:Zinc finger, C2H2 type